MTLRTILSFLFVASTSVAAAHGQLFPPGPRESPSAWPASVFQRSIVWQHEQATARAPAERETVPSPQPPASSGEQARERWQRVDDILSALKIAEGSTVADIGAGGGFFTVRLARVVGPSGRVYAVDITREVLTGLRKRVSDEGLQNVEVIHGEPDDPKLPAGSLDAALIVNAYHEMPAHEPMLAHVRKALKPQGRLVLVEPIVDARRDLSRDEQVRRHQIAPEFVTREARKVGFDIVGLEDPFTMKPDGNELEWLLVLRPSRRDAANTSTSVRVPSVPSAAAERRDTTPGSDADWKAPVLRISLDEFKRLLAVDGVIVVDVRDGQSYREGHIPGALSMPRRG
jgi:ubiquinone/menaquinone biosynthesis C-methylase UbiE